jgi:DNA-binding LytR/AlgR family response regulator
MQKVLIVEDDLNQLNLLYETIHAAYPSWTIQTACGYAHAKSLISDSIKKEELFSLFLLDVQLSSETADRGGFFLAQMLREEKCYYLTPILFLTAVSDDNYFALSHFHCYNYIPKPYSPSDILAQLHHMLLTGYLQENTIELPDTQRVLHRIHLSDIIFIKSGAHMLLIKCMKYSFQTRQYSLDAILPLLGEGFVRCHKQYVFNIEKMTAFDSATRYITLIDKETIPVGKLYLQNTRQIIETKGVFK